MSRFRKGMSQRGAKRQFRKGANRSHPFNQPRLVMRGGIRL